ncbi:MAG: hypothetical protein RL172_2874 [Bacteroidota bacterium]
MSEAVIIFPHQLFKNNPALQAGKPVYLVEEWLFFRQYNFHQHKILLHRSSMKFYEDYLVTQNCAVHYIDSNDALHEVGVLIAHLARQQIKRIAIVDVADNWLLKRIKLACTKFAITLTIYPSPAFLNTMDEVAGFFTNKKKFFQTDFYTWQRKQRNVLMDADGRPIGGQWSFDAANRQKFPKNTPVPALQFASENKYITEANNYVLQHFSSNTGSVNAPYYFACTFNDADKCLDDFLKNRFKNFGVYEDAMVANEVVLHHSVLTPMLNTGLLTPADVLQKVIKYASENSIPLNSTEGFVRQIMGWREYVRIVYELQGSMQRTTNFWKFKRKIPASFWTGTTGITPVDTTIKKVLKTGYCHHIERLMVLGNFMLLCEFDPDEVYKWFMEMFIDAYDWVMVPNVYGMTQFADGGLITTKPYISGSNYLLKMSDYPKGDWQQVWDGLFWRFMHTHQNFFLKNPRLGMLLGTFNKMSEVKRQAHLTVANNFLKQL